MEEFLKRSYTGARQALRWRHQVRLPREGAGGGNTPTVYFLTPDHDQPAGGIRVIYRHVDILNRAGIPAAVMHQQRGFRCTWFPNETPVCSSRNTVLGPADLLVVGELDAHLLAGAQRRSTPVIFNQNQFLTWRSDPQRTAEYYRDGPGPRAILTVSEDARAFLAHTFPGVPVSRVHLGIDPTLFHPPQQPTSQVISYMPRKQVADDAEVVLQVARARGVLRDWRVAAIHGVGQVGAAQALRQSRIFLSLASREGFGLPGAEAMACGAYVIGFHGFGGREFLDARYCAPVESGDLLALAQALEAAIQREIREPGWLAERGREAARAIAAAYHPDQEAAEVEGFYRGLR